MTIDDILDRLAEEMPLFVSDLMKLEEQNEVERVLHLLRALHLCGLWFPTRGEMPARGMLVLPNISVTRVAPGRWHDALHDGRNKANALYKVAAALRDEHDHRQ